MASIPDEAIEAVAKAIDPEAFEEHMQEEVEEALGAALAALEVALPIVREEIAREVKAAAWAEGYNRASRINEGWHDVERHNPYTGGAA